MTDQTTNSSTTDDATDAAKTDEGKPPADKGADEMSAGGRKALDSERQARRDAERRATEAQERADRLERGERVRTIAVDKGLTPAQTAFLTGTTADELAASADELLAAFAPADADEPRRRPREHLTSGNNPSGQPTNMGAVADDVMRR